MISQFLASVNVKNGSEIWLGGRQMDFHNFNWGDGSLFNYSYWEHGEPSFPAEKCIEMSWRNGRWNDINCRLKRAVLCERQVSSRHHMKPNLYQPTTCLDSNCTTSSAANISGIIESSQSDTDPLSGGNSTTINVGELGNSTTVPNATHLMAEEGPFLPLDDKPIKVIASIMHRPTVEPPIESLLIGSSNEQVNNSGVIITNNLPSTGQTISNSVPGSDNLTKKSTVDLVSDEAKATSSPPSQQVFDIQIPQVDKGKLGGTNNSTPIAGSSAATNLTSSQTLKEVS